MRKLVAVLVMLVMVWNLGIALGVEITITSPSDEQTETSTTSVTVQPTNTLTDYRKSTWGMTIEEVKAAEGEQEWNSSDNEMYAYFGNIAGMDVIFSFLFDSTGKLYRGIILNIESHSNKTIFVADYRILKDALSEKYGTPLTDKTTWLNDLFKDDPSDYGLAISIGHLVYSSTWKTDTTDIMMILKGDNYKINHAIIYSDVNYVQEKNTTGL